MDFNVGTIVKTMGRDWVVHPSIDPDLLIIKPIDGKEIEKTAIYTKLPFENKIEQSEFKKPQFSDFGEFYKSKMLYRGIKLAIRDSAAPFRSLAKLSFRPRGYQMVPLIMALKQYKRDQKGVRVLIADDVGVGKTIEALLVVKELLERKQIKRFAVIALPHLCEQWQTELKNKFNIDAVVVKSNTMGKLDKKIQGDEDVYKYYPYQIISIDLIKRDNKINNFIQSAPEFIIVDEAHTASTSQNSSQQKRHELIKRLSEKKDRGIILLTATPHSGKDDQFRSLLSILDEKFLDIDINDQKNRKELAKYYIQRRRAHIIGNDTKFPERKSTQIVYKLGGKYQDFYKDVLDFTIKLAKGGDEKNRRFRYWGALTLLRGVMSSPEAGISMFKNRMNKKDKEIDNLSSEHTFLEDGYSIGDVESAEDLSVIKLKKGEYQSLKSLTEQLEGLKGEKFDSKIKSLIDLVKKWIKKDINTIIFCRYINTAKYVGEILKQLFKKSSKTDIEVVTSEDPDEIRRDRIEKMDKKRVKILVATDCLSEGINLQENFSGVIHYDLPWNPNRLEQREGRVDRFGQKCDIVYSVILYSEENPIDKTIMQVLYRKIEEIRRAIGVTIPFADDNKELLEYLFEEVIKQSEKKGPKELAFVELEQGKELENRLEEAFKREIKTRSIFAQNRIKVEEIQEDLKESDNAIGTPKDVELFVIDSLREYGVYCNEESIKGCYQIEFTDSKNRGLSQFLPDGDSKYIYKITFNSPEPKGYIYIGRNHPLVEELGYKILNDFVITDKIKGRVSVIYTKEVKIRTTLLIFRVRDVIKDIKKGDTFLSEEVIVTGFEGSKISKEVYQGDRWEQLYKKVISSDRKVDGFMAERQFDNIKNIVFEQLYKKDGVLNSLAGDRNEKLVQSYERFYTLLNENRGKRDIYQVVKPIMPMDLISMAILLPD